MKRKNLLKVFSVFAVSALTAGALAIGTPTVEASAATNETFEMQAGASVRLPVGDETVYGIKYTAQIHSSEYVETDKYYVMIIPTGWLKTWVVDESEYTLSKTYDENCDYYDILVNKVGKDPSFDNPENRTINIMESTPKAKGDLYTISGSIVDVMYANSYREFFGIVYKTDANGENRVYAEFNEGENVRSISQVASAALNDLSYGYTTDQKDDLKDLVTDGYNAWLGNDSTTDELPIVSAESVSLALEKDKTYQLNAPDSSDEFIEKLGLDVDYTTTDETQATVTDEGLVTVKADGAQATVKSLVLGQEYTVAGIVQDSIVLNGFDTEATRRHFRNNSAWNWTSGEWMESVEIGGETRYGVVKEAYDTTYKMYYMTFDKTLAQLQGISDDFDYISISLYVETEETGTVQNTSWSMMGEIINLNEWCELKISKDFITAENSISYWSYYKTDAYETVSDYFWYCHASDGFGFGSYVPMIKFPSSFTSAANVYVDSVTLVRSEIDYTTPESGTEFSSSIAKLKGIDGAIVATSENPVTVSYQTNSTSSASDVTLTDGKFTAKVGIYTLNYNLVYGEKNYNTITSFSIARPAMAANMLENFDDAVSLDNVLNANNITDASLEDWHAEYDGHTGVVQVSGKGSQVNLKFNRTQAELNAIDFDYITVNMYVDVGWILTNTQIFGVVKTLQNRQWITVTVTKEELITAHGSVEAFFQEFSSEGLGRKFAYFGCHEATFYIDEISFGKN